MFLPPVYIGAPIAALSPAAGGGGTWVPTDEASLVAWFDAEIQGGANASAVTQITDQSGLGNNGTQATGSKQATVVTGAQNGLRAWEFVAASEQHYGLPNIYNGASAALGIVVFKINNDPPASGKGGLWTFGTDQEVDLWPHTDLQIYDGFCSDERKNAQGDPSPSLASDYRIIAVHSASNDYKSFIDGVQFFSTGTNTVAFKTAPWFGLSDKQDTTAFWYLDGRVLAAYFYSAITDTIRQKTEGYAAHRFNLDGNLDAGHPYKSSPP